MVILNPEQKVEHSLLFDAAEYAEYSQNNVIFAPSQVYSLLLHCNNLQYLLDI